LSVLSQPQGTPERVWSLIDGLQAAGGLLRQEDFVALLNPGYTREGSTVAVHRTQAQNAVGVSTSLKLVEKEGSEFRLAVATGITRESFSDLIHDVLLEFRGAEPNAVMLDAYAWLVAESHRRKDLAWCADMDRTSMVEAMLVGLTGDDDDGSRPMNTTKLPAWQRWLVFIGLCEDLPTPSKSNFWHFSPARRIARELARAEVEVDMPMSGSDFMRLIALRCPYLDGGRKYAQACTSIGYTHGPRELSAALTVGLRELEADGILDFNLIGDSSDALYFVPDPSFRTNSFNRVTVRGSIS